MTAGTGKADRKGKAPPRTRRTRTPDPRAVEGKSLIIVESPAKAKTINKYLGQAYAVEASVGHVKNLPKSRLGIDAENGFALEYETIKGKDEVLRRLRVHARAARAVYLATDPDREGEAIAWHIAQEVEPENPHIFRVLFHEITERGITAAMDAPKKIDARLVDAQQARRAMDRLVGYTISPFLWKTIFYGLSAGRVQSVALRLICEREAAVASFVSTEYWSIVAEFRSEGKDPFLARLARVGDREPSIGDTAAAEALGSDIRSRSFAVADIQTRPVRRNPPAPFITSTLQQEAARRLRFHAKRTMMLAQKLYEGVELGEEGRVGLITYMRTDSTRLSEDAVRDVREFIFTNYGKEYVPHERRLFKRARGSQDAHEAIRPTSLRFTPRAVRRFLDEDMAALYELVWNRFLACQMTAAVSDQTTVEVRGGPYLFRASDSMPRFRGFLQVYEEAAEGEERDPDEDPVSRLPAGLRPGEEAALERVIPNQHFTKPPPRYTESTLVKELESLGIGRPSTYALIVDTIQARKYVEQRERRLFPTELGTAVHSILVQSFPHLFNVGFTARMEEELDTIASAERSYAQVMEDFYRPFMRDVEGMQKHSAAIKKSLQETTDEACELCGKPMIIKWGRNGRFMACSGYPGCKNTKPLPHEQEQTRQNTGITCDLCGGDMVVKGGRFGTFMGCANYPACKNTKPLSIGVHCPKCADGYVIERRTRRKRVFYGCSRYPACDFASWDRPVGEPCDTCGNTYMVLKSSQARGEYLACPACKAEVARPGEVQETAS
ncbi:MAG: type I DNA topoisomerase [Bacteroidota bacterium]